MESVAHPQSARLRALVHAAKAGDAQARNGMLFCSSAGLALVNAAFDLFECDALYDLACDVAREAHLDRRGRPLREQEP